MGFFDDNHVLQAGLQGSLGPSVGFWDMMNQGYQQRSQVNSELSLDAELQSRWLESLQALRERGQNFDAPNDGMYRGYANFVRSGASSIPAEADETVPLMLRGAIPRVRADFENMQRADAAIQQLHDPNVRTFAQILDAVSSMQHDTEERTASMSERTGTMGAIGGFLGDVGGSFTFRNPVNLVTLPLGAGRTIATRIATDVAINAGVAGLTDVAEINPNRALVGLPQNNPIYDMAAAGLGAALFRGALIEPLSHVLGHLRSAGDDINLDFRDEQLHQMFTANEHSPTARAGASILEDTQVFEHSNPYGDGHVAGYRWEAELEDTAHALNGEPTVRPELPPLPSDQIERSLSFQSVKETAPELWQGLEDARAKLSELDGNIAEASTRELTIPDAVRMVDQEAGAKLDQLSQVVNDESLPEPVRAAADMEARTTVLRVGQDKIMKAVEVADTKAKYEVQNLRASRKAVNKQYRQAYQKVEQEAQRLEQAEVAKRSIAQMQAIDVLGPAAVSEPLTGPMTRFDFVEAHAGRVDAAEKVLPAKEEAVNDLKVTVTNPTVIGKAELLKAAGADADGVDAGHAGEVLRKASDEALTRGDTVVLYADGKPIEITQPGLVDAKGQKWGTMNILTDHNGSNRLEIGRGGTVDIGSKTPVSLDFKVPFDDGEISVKDVLADLAEDKRLEEAVKGCAI